MRRRAGRFALVVSALLISSFLAAQEVPLRNWTVPPYHAMGGSGGLTTMADVTPGIAFVGVAPCRLVNTTNAGFPATYGPPALSANTPRNFDLNNNPQCPGIPDGVDAYSLNITAAGTQGPGFIVIYPQGGAVPVVSTLNYVGGQTVANAAIVPAAANGGVTVIAGTSGTHLIIDINGYFTDSFNPGGQVRVVANVGNDSALHVENTAAFSGSRAVLGLASGATGITWGVLGHTDSSTAGAAGVRGVATAGVGATYGVIGVTSSTASGSAGVYGDDGTAQPHVWIRAGVHGAGFYDGVSGFSASGYGVFGGSATGRGVVGRRANEVSSTFGILGYDDTVGVHSIGHITATGAKPFIEPHPVDPTKEIAFVALEGPEAGTYFRGKGKFQRGTAVIAVPESFRMVTDSEGLSIQVTPIGEMATVAVVSLGLDRIVVKGSRDVDFFYTVNGVRQAFKDWEVIQSNTHYVPEEPGARMPLAYAPEQRRRLIATGIYNADGTVNMETARRLGWDKEWEKRGRPAPQPTE